MPHPAARVVLGHALARPTTLGSGRLVCVDGPAGSGKSTLARALVDELTALSLAAAVVQMDDLYEGWGGLATVDRQLDGLLTPLADDRCGSYRRWDWHAGGFAETVTVDPVDVLLVEGVGAAASRMAALITTLVWVWAPEDLRFARGIERDGEKMLPQWERWVAEEPAHFARERTPERADVTVDGTGRTAPVVFS